MCVLWLTLGSCEAGMITGIYRLIATFRCAWPADLVATGVKPVLLDPRGSVIGAPLRVPMDRVGRGSDPRWGTSVRELGLAGRRRFGGRLTGRSTKRKGGHGSTDEGDRC